MRNEGQRLSIESLLPVRGTLEDSQGHFGKEVTAKIFTACREIAPGIRMNDIAIRVLTLPNVKGTATQLRIKDMVANELHLVTLQLQAAEETLLPPVANAPFSLNALRAIRDKLSFRKESPYVAVVDNETDPQVHRFNLDEPLAVEGNPSSKQVMRKHFVVHLETDPSHVFICSFAHGSEVEVEVNENASPLLSNQRRSAALNALLRPGAPLTPEEIKQKVDELRQTLLEPKEEKVDDTRPMTRLELQRGEQVHRVESQYYPVDWSDPQLEKLRIELLKGVEIKAGVSWDYVLGGMASEVKKAPQLARAIAVRINQDISLRNDFLRLTNGNAARIQGGAVLLLGAFGTDKTTADSGMIVLHSDSQDTMRAWWQTHASESKVTLSGLLMPKEDQSEDKDTRRTLGTEQSASISSPKIRLLFQK
jgi:hypothetical protein